MRLKVFTDFKSWESLIFLGFFIILFNVIMASALEPSGGSLTPGTPETAPSDPAGSVNAQAGNVTELNIFGYSITQTWQGYFGNVSGTIILADANDKVMYNWSLASSEG